MTYETMEKYKTGINLHHDNAKAEVQSKIFDRTELTKNMGLEHAINNNSNPNSPKSKIRIQIDKQLAKAFGAKHFLTYDWNIGSSKNYTKKEIADVISGFGVKINEMVVDKTVLIVNKLHQDMYFFNPIDGTDKYELDYCRFSRSNGLINYE